MYYCVFCWFCRVNFEFETFFHIDTQSLIIFPNPPQRNPFSSRTRPESRDSDRRRSREREIERERNRNTGTEETSTRCKRKTNFHPKRSTVRTNCAHYSLGFDFGHRAFVLGRRKQADVGELANRHLNLLYGAIRIVGNVHIHRYRFAMMVQLWTQ